MRIQTLTEKKEVKDVGPVVERQSGLGDGVVGKYYYVKVFKLLYGVIVLDVEHI